MCNSNFRISSHSLWYDNANILPNVCLFKDEKVYNFWGGIYLKEVFTIEKVSNKFCQTPRWHFHPRYKQRNNNARIPTSREK